MSKSKNNATVGAVNADIFRQLTARRLADQVAALKGFEPGTEEFGEARRYAIDAAETDAMSDYAGMVEADALALSLARED